MGCCGGIGVSAKNTTTWSVFMEAVELGAGGASGAAVVTQVTHVDFFSFPFFLALHCSLTQPDMT